MLINEDMGNSSVQPDIFIDQQGPPPLKRSEDQAAGKQSGENEPMPEMWSESSFLGEPLFLSELLAEEEKRIYSTPPSQQNADAYSRIQPMSLRSTISTKQDTTTPSPSPSNNTTKQDYQIQYLLEEVERLKDNNSDLSSKLMNVTDELNEVKMRTQNLYQLLGGFLVQRDQQVASSVNQ